MYLWHDFELVMECDEIYSLWYEYRLISVIQYETKFMLQIYCNWFKYSTTNYCVTCHKRRVKEWNRTYLASGLASVLRSSLATAGAQAHTAT